MWNTILFFGLFLVGILGVYFGAESGLWHETFVGIFSFALGLMLQWFNEKKSTLKSYLEIKWLQIKRQPLRISFSALVKIKLDKEYLLVKSARITDQWQPVGGVYKFFDENKTEELGLRDDKMYKDSPKNEFRLEFPHEKVLNAFKLEKWFYEKTGREITPHREFYEELIKTGTLDKELFAVLNFKFLNSERIYSYSEHFKKQELKIFEIFEFIPTPEQLKAIQTLKDSKNQAVVFLDQDTIERHGVKTPSTEEYRVGSHTQYVL